MRAKAIVKRARGVKTGGRVLKTVKVVVVYSELSFPFILF